MAALMLEMCTASQDYAGEKGSVNALLMLKMTIFLFCFSIYYPGNMMTHSHTFKCTKHKQAELYLIVMNVPQLIIIKLAKPS